MNRASFAKLTPRRRELQAANPAPILSLDAARARLTELEAGFAVEKAQVEAMKARLFARRRGHFQRHERLRLVIGYRRKYLESLVWQGESIELEILRVPEAGHAGKIRNPKQILKA